MVSHFNQMRDWPYLVIRVVWNVDQVRAYLVCMDWVDTSVQSSVHTHQHHILHTLIKKHLYRERESTGSPVHTRLAAHPLYLYRGVFACNDPIFSIPTLPRWIKTFLSWNRLHTLTALDIYFLENDPPFNLLHTLQHFQLTPHHSLSLLIISTICRIHWWIRNRRRSPLPKDRSRTQRPPQQVRSHLPPFRRSSKRSWEVDCEPFALTSVRTHSLVYYIWYYDTWRG